MVYATDEERPENRPDDISLEDFKMLLKYWGHLDVQETLEKKLNSSEGLDGIEELISGGKKSYTPGWLIGRHDAKTVKNATSAPTDQYVQELTKKIKENLVEEMEAKIEKIN
ncbi:hypothetical protein AgCh_000312 [Apium graveolens]